MIYVIIFLALAAVFGLGYVFGCVKTTDEYREYLDYTENMNIKLQVDALEWRRRFENIDYYLSNR